MRFINKRTNEPSELIAFKKRLEDGVKDGMPMPSKPYDALGSDKGGETFKAFQRTLSKEQGDICAYCMGTLKDKEKKLKMKVEHFKPQSIYNGEVNTVEQNKKLCDDKQTLREDLQIAYSNLLAVCTGRSEGPGSETHCDTPPNGKDNWELCFIPNPSAGRANQFNLKLRYTKNFSIFSDDQDINRELNTRLNLNEQNLRGRREREWKAVSRKLTNITGLRNWEEGDEEFLKEVRKLIKTFKQRKKNGQYYEFCDCIVYMLEKRFRGKL